ncbi:hypothetical protein BDZ89DRAFT_1233223 [Hymenopellis radicata]|nr:hypothetical protein BDZ89DRAFT_1233223 [Hymenopellis radicata]
MAWISVGHLNGGKLPSKNTVGEQLHDQAHRGGNYPIGTCPPLGGPKNFLFERGDPENAGRDAISNMLTFFPKDTSPLHVILSHKLGSHSRVMGYMNIRSERYSTLGLVEVQFSPPGAWVIFEVCDLVAQFYLPSYPQSSTLGFCPDVNNWPKLTSVGRCENNKSFRNDMTFSPADKISGFGIHTYAQMDYSIASGTRLVANFARKDAYIASGQLFREEAL